MIFLFAMRTDILSCGFLKVRAAEMFNQLSNSRISEFYPIDPEGYIRISMNSLLVREKKQVVLLDPGCAEFLPSRLIQSYGLEIPVSLEDGLRDLGLTSDQVTDVIFTHLHFDHGSGAFERVPGKIRKRFADARYHVLKEHFDYAVKPDRKESNTFFTTLFKYIEGVHWLEDWQHNWLDYQVFNGHTKGMIVPRIRRDGREIFYLSDLAPMELFLENDVSCGYDLDPNKAMQEKRDFLSRMGKDSELILFHDPHKVSVFYP